MIHYGEDVFDASIGRAVTIANIEVGFLEEPIGPLEGFFVAWRMQNGGKGAKGCYGLISVI